VTKDGTKNLFYVKNKNKKETKKGPTRESVGINRDKLKQLEQK
jgi:hypothetical protein